MGTTQETRRESYEEVLTDLSDKQALTLMNLRLFDNGATAKELAVFMHLSGLVASPERNSVHPRLNELVDKGLVAVTGKKICDYTSRKVAIYKCKL